MDNQRQPKTVLITGASAGIGKAFAETFARQGFDVILVARRDDKLKEISAQIKKTYGQMAYPLTDDLADPSTPERLFNWCQEREIQVDALVNNAGYALSTGFLENSWNAHRDFIQVHNMSTAHLCHLFAGNMKANGYGRIINMASIAAWLPELPGNLYNAAKAFTVHFSQSLDLELQEYGVYCTALCPGFTFSEFHDVMGTRSKVRKLPRFLWMTAEEVANEGYQAVMEHKTVHVPGLINQGLSQFMSAMPASLKQVVAKRQTLL